MAIMHNQLIGLMGDKISPQEYFQQLSRNQVMGAMGLNKYPSREPQEVPQQEAKKDLLLLTIEDGE